MEKSELSRREILSGLAFVGGASGLVTGGTVAMLSNEDEFERNTLAAGVVDLDVAWTRGDQTGTSEGDATIPIEITEGNRRGRAELTASLTEGSNPVYVWLGMQCPEPASNIIDNLLITLRYADGTLIEVDGTEIKEEPLLPAAEMLRGGVGLNPDTESSQQECLGPDQTIDLVVEWEVPDTYNGDDSATATFEFIGHQCRNNERRTNPFRNTLQDCEGPVGPSGQEINFVAFCTGDVVSKPSNDSTDYIDDVTYNNAGEPIAVEWSTSKAVEYVIVKGGTDMWIYDYRKADRKSGTAAAGTEDQGNVTKYEDAGDVSNPCEVAATVTEGDFDGTAITIDYNGD